MSEDDLELRGADRPVATSSEDIIDGLLSQHQQIKLLFGQVASATGDHRQPLFQELVTLLAVHESVEQSIVHPLAGEAGIGATVVQERLGEEEDAKAALAELYELGPADPRFDDQLTALRDAVAAHAEAEERLEFARLREVVDAAELTRMALAMEVAAAFLATRSGAPSAVFDEVRDAFQAAVRDNSEAAS
jgi:hypothetical protein